MVFLLLSGLKCSEGQMNIVREMKWCSVQEYENPDDPIEKATQQTQTGLVFWRIAVCCLISIKLVFRDTPGCPAVLHLGPGLCFQTVFFPTKGF